jgi:hypothetical protein
MILNTSGLEEILVITCGVHLTCQPMSVAMKCTLRVILLKSGNELQVFSLSSLRDCNETFIFCISVTFILRVRTCYFHLLLFSSRATLLKGQPTQWSSGQSSWLQIQSFGLDSRHYQIFWEVVGLKRSPDTYLMYIHCSLEYGFCTVSATMTFVCQRNQKYHNDIHKCSFVE